jgi:glycosyltransferase involved in cell wall biosynthesis
MQISVVIPTRDQCHRLSLVLCGLENQTLSSDAFEIIVVDDGCSDGTAEMVALRHVPNLRLLPPQTDGGRNVARNRGIAAAKGDWIVFLDGDALPAPDLLECYVAAFREYGEDAVLCGMSHCLPDLEHFDDPQTGEPRRGAFVGVLQELLEARRDDMVVTEAMVRSDFARIAARAVPGGYPLEASKLRQEQFLALCCAYPRAETGWVGFVPHNGAIARRRLLEVGGFDEAIPFCEGWELAYRLQRTGGRVHAVDATTYHLYHYHPFNDPVQAREQGNWRYDAVEYMAAKHGDDRIRLLYFWYAALWPDSLFPEECLVRDLSALERQYTGLPAELWRQYRIVLENHPFIPVLPQK